MRGAVIMNDIKKPFNGLRDSIWKGEIKDSLGRTLLLRNSNMIESFRLSAIVANMTEGGGEKSGFCNSTCSLMLKVASIDGVILPPPLSSITFEANLNKIGEEGLIALLNHAQENGETEKEEIDTTKK